MLLHIYVSDNGSGYMALIIPNTSVIIYASILWLSVGMISYLGINNYDRIFLTNKSQSDLKKELIICLIFSISLLFLTLFVFSPVLDTFVNIVWIACSAILFGYAIYLYRILTDYKAFRKKIAQTKYTYKANAFDIIAVISFGLAFSFILQVAEEHLFIRISMILIVVILFSMVGTVSLKNMLLEIGKKKNSLKEYSHKFLFISIIYGVMIIVIFNVLLPDLDQLYSTSVIATIIGIAVLLGTLIAIIIHTKKQREKNLSESV